MSLSSYLQRDDNHEYLFFLAGENVFDEGPAGADEGEHSKQKRALDPVQAKILIIILYEP